MKQGADAIVNVVFESLLRNVSQTNSTAANNERLEIRTKSTCMEVDDCQEM